MVSVPGPFTPFIFIRGHVRSTIPSLPFRFCLELYINAHVLSFLPLYYLFPRLCIYISLLSRTSFDSYADQLVIRTVLVKDERVTFALDDRTTPRYAQVAGPTFSVTLCGRYRQNTPFTTLAVDRMSEVWLEDSTRQIYRVVVGECHAVEPSGEFHIFDIYCCPDMKEGTHQRGLHGYGFLRVPSLLVHPCFRFDPAMFLSRPTSTIRTWMECDLTYPPGLDLAREPRIWYEPLNLGRDTRRIRLDTGEVVSASSSDDGSDDFFVGDWQKRSLLSSTSRRRIFGLTFSRRRFR